MKRQRSPQEKKRLSLTRDHPLLAKYPKAFRKSWPKQTRSAERARRTADRIALATDADDFVPTRRESVRKWGGAPLGDVIAGKLERRARLRENPRKSAAARERRRLRRGRRGAP